MTEESPTSPVLVDTIELLRDTLDTIYVLPASPPSLFVDIEGWDLCRDGRIALISIYTAPLKRCFVVDVHALGEDSFATSSLVDPTRTLKALLESDDIPKVLYDCRNDSDALFNIFHVDMAGVHDVQLMELATRPGRKHRVKWASVFLTSIISKHFGSLSGLARTIQDYAGLEKEELEIWKATKIYGKEQMNREGSTSAFEERPLDPKLLAYSIQDVTYLPKLWACFDAKLNPKWRKKVEEETFWRLQLSRQSVYYGRDSSAMTQGPW